MDTQNSNQQKPKHIGEEEIEEVFDEVQKESSTEHEVDPSKIDAVYVGDLDGDEINVNPEEAELEIDREEKSEHTSKDEFQK